MGKIMLSDLAKELMARHGVSKNTADLFLTSIVECMQDGIADDGIVKVKGLGTFKLVDVDARESVNVNSGQRVVIDSHQKLTFVPDSAMKELVNKPFSQFETVILNEGVDNDMLNKISEKEQALLNRVEEADEQEPEPEPDDEDADERPAEESVVATASPVETPKEEPANDSPTTETAPADENDIDNPAVFEQPSVSEQDYFKDEIKKEEKKEENYWWAWALLAMAACVASFAGGYLYGTSVASVDVEELTAVVIDTTAAQKETPKDSVAPEKSVGKDTIGKKQEAVSTVKPKEEKKAPEVKPKEEKKAPEVKPKEEKKAPEVKPKEEKKAPEVKPEAKTDADWEKYDKMDSRLSTGAYGIVGTDHVVTAKEGQTIANITRSTLGPGMECYIEVYNGIKASEKLKAGQKVEIPKVELKKKLRNNNQNNKK